MTYQGKIQDKATIVRLSCAFSWGTITDKDITDETNTNKGSCKDALRVRKTLLPAAAGVHVAFVRSTLASFYQYHCRKTYATPTKGDRIMPVLFHFEYEEKFAETTALAQQALDTLIDKYPSSIELAESLLGTSFNANDYPDVAEINRFFTLQRRYLPVPSGDAIMNALGAGVAADVDSYVGEMMTSAASDARQRLREAVARMAENLATKGTKLYDTMFESIDELARELPIIAGLTNDPKLADMVKEVQATLTGHDRKTMKDDDVARSRVGQAAADILKRMGG